MEFLSHAKREAVNHWLSDSNRPCKQQISCLTRPFSLAAALADQMVKKESFDSALEESKAHTRQPRVLDSLVRLHAAANSSQTCSFKDLRPSGNTKSECSTVSVGAIMPEHEISKRQEDGARQEILTKAPGDSQQRAYVTSTCRQESRSN
eukprot:2866290-Pleurochrysis_carterae.AAC.2